MGYKATILLLGYFVFWALGGWVVSLLAPSGSLIAIGLCLVYFGFIGFYYSVVKQ